MARTSKTQEITCRARVKNTDLTFSIFSLMFECFRFQWWTHQEDAPSRIGYVFAMAKAWSLIQLRIKWRRDSNRASLGVCCSFLSALSAVFFSSFFPFFLLCLSCPYVRVKYHRSAGASVWTGFAFNFRVCLPVGVSSIVFLDNLFFLSVSCNIRLDNSVSPLLSYLEKIQLFSRMSPRYKRTTFLRIIGSSIL